MSSLLAWDRVAFPSHNFLCLGESLEADAGSKQEPDLQLSTKPLVTHGRAGCLAVQDVGKFTVHDDLCAKVHATVVSAASLQMIRWLWGDWAALLCEIDLATHRRVCTNKHNHACRLWFHLDMQCWAVRLPACLQLTVCLASRKLLFTSDRSPATAWMGHSASCWQTEDAAVVLNFEAKAKQQLQP